jgi:hypothetical protein
MRATSDGTGRRAGAVVIALAFLSAFLPAPGDGSVSAHRQASAALTAAAPPPPGDRASPHAGLPVTFVPNRGQFAPVVRYQASVGGTAVFATDEGLTVVPAPDHSGSDGAATGTGTVLPRVLHLRFDGTAAGMRILPGARLPGVTHYLRSNDPGGWITNVPTFAGITYRGLYDGVDLHVDARAGALAIRFDVAPGVNPDVIRWRYFDETGRRVRPAPGAADGALAVVGVLGSVPVHAPSGRDPDTTDPVGDAVSQAGGTPTLVYSTFLGGRSSDLVRGLAVDADGYAYIAGSTMSLDFPVAGALQPEIGNSGILQDAFVAKLDPTGTHLVYSTFLGGNRQDEAFALAVDRAGRVHVTGYTDSPDFPTRNPLQARLHLADGIFSGDPFIAKLTPDGSALEFGTFFGGTARDIGKGIAVDAAGFVYVTGWTGSNFPAIHALHALNRGIRDAFLVKLAPGGDKVVYSTHLGGSYSDEGRRIAVDGAGNAYIVGTSESLNLPTVAPYQRVIAGREDAFVARLNADGTAFDYVTYLGGRGVDRGIDIAVTPAGEAYVLGWTDSPNFPRVGALQNARSGPTDLFVTRLSARGDALVFSTYLGGSGDEGDCVTEDNFREFATPTPDPRGIRFLEGSKFTDGPVGGIAVDAAGQVHVASCTRSSNLPLERPIQSHRTGDYALMVSVLDPSGGRLLFGTYLGGRSMNVARALAVGADGGIYVAGQTDSPDFPTAPGAGPLQGARDGTDDAFVLKIGPALEVAPTLTPAYPTAPPTATATEEPTSTPLPTADTPTVEPTPTLVPTDTPTATATLPAVVPVHLPIAYCGR